VNYCPSCGSWDNTIIPNMGWCTKCVLEHHPNLNICARCTTAFPRKNNNKYCKQCMYLNWIEKHIDLIEEYMIVGYSFTSARYRVMADIRPTCISCGAVITNAKPGSRFCSTNSQCRTYLRRYRKYIQAGVNREEATRKAMHERNSDYIRGILEG